MELLQALFSKPIQYLKWFHTVDFCAKYVDKSTLKLFHTRHNKLSLYLTEIIILVRLTFDNFLIYGAVI